MLDKQRSLFAQASQRLLKNINREEDPALAKRREEAISFPQPKALRKHEAYQYWVSPLSRKQAIMLRLSILPWVLGSFLFVVWWMQPSHHTNLLGSIIGTSVCFLNILVPAYFYAFVRRMKVVNPYLQPSPNWRVAIVVTKAPSEPWDIVRTNLLAMLVQDVPHDTWLADESPTEETMEWCRLHGIMVSTRRDSPQYHRTTWPRRRRCKEGNLAYFYDHYGYDQYDFVAQLDADHIPEPDYLRRIITPFLDDGVGYVAAPSICGNNSSKSWAARGRLYSEATMHGPLQSGYNDGWAPLCIGSHYAVRTKALKEIGGLGPELAEDHSTTLIMNANGWKGVFEPNAIANGDGPSSFVDCMNQEYQWSRSLMMILCEWTPRYLRKMPLRLRFQFLFSQSWYSIFSTVAILGYLLPLLCLALDTPILRMSYITFLTLSILVGSLNFFPIYFLKRFGMLRPKQAPLLSWESQLFTLTRFPWVFYGIVNGAYSVLSKKQLDFRVTPKGLTSTAPLPFRSIIPYLLVSFALYIGVFTIQPVMVAKGYYFLALLSATTMLVSAVLIVALHLRENQLSPPRGFLKHGLSILILFILAYFSASLRLRESLPAIAWTKDAPHETMNHKVIRSDELRIDCDGYPCFGYYDPKGTLGAADVPSGIHHYFISWGPAARKNISQALVNDGRHKRKTMITLELWPWAVLDKSNLSTYQERERRSNSSLLFDIASGKYDSYLASSLNALQQDPKRIVYLRLMHEMEVDGQYPWSGREPKEYIRAYQHIVDLSRKLGLENIRWVWSPAGNPNAYYYWPGRDYVDYVGMSIYATPEWNGGLASEDSNLSLWQLVAPKYWLALFQKPLILAEVGVNSSGEDKTSWLAKAKKELRLFPSLVAWIYFNDRQPPIVDLGIGLPDWQLTSQQAAQLRIILQGDER
jgi:cellulose synthase (UDP-forming)